MYAGTSREFQVKMSSWTKNTPLAAVREGVDREELVKDAEFAGGRPVSNVLCSSSFFRCFAILGLWVKVLLTFGG